MFKVPSKKTNAIVPVPFPVPAIRFATFIKKVLYGVQVKLMKMDIEGAEYRVLTDLLHQGLLCQKHIGAIMLEVHPSVIHTLAPKYKGSFKLLYDDIAAQDCNATELLDFDDETFLHDVRDSLR